MIVLDYSQVAISNIMQNLMSPESGGKLEPDLIKHMILNSIRSYLVKYGNSYGKLVICCDSRTSWRKEIFAHYKQNRKKNRDESSINWDEIFAIISEMKQVLKDHFPYSVVEVDGAEADDIIAVLAKQYHKTENIMILSADHDYAQLQKYKGVKQYAPVQKKEIIVEDPHKSLMEHIIQGDKGDGVPNFLSPDNSFVDGIRQKSIMSAKLKVWVTQTKEEICTTPEMIKNWERNEQMVCFDFIPSDIVSAILREYDSKKTPTLNKNSIYNYMLAAKMRQLVNYLDDFMIGQNKEESVMTSIFG